MASYIVWPRHLCLMRHRSSQKRSKFSWYLSEKKLRLCKKQNQMSRIVTVSLMTQYITSYKKTITLIRNYYFTFGILSNSYKTYICIIYILFTFSLKICFNSMSFNATVILDNPLQFPASIVKFWHWSSLKRFISLKWYVYAHK